MKGTIKRINENGYGFITPEQGGSDVFFHASDCSNQDFKEMQQGQEVNFEMGQSPKGPKAVDVVLA